MNFCNDYVKKKIRIIIENWKMIKTSFMIFMHIEKFPKLLKVWWVSCISSLNIIVKKEIK